MDLWSNNGYYNTIRNNRVKTFDPALNSEYYSDVGAHAFFTKLKTQG